MLTPKVKWLKTNKTIPIFRHEELILWIPEPGVPVIDIKHPDADLRLVVANAVRDDDGKGKEDLGLKIQTLV